MLQRYRFSLLVALLFLPCVAAAGLWVRSYSVCDEVKWKRYAQAGRCAGQQWWGVTSVHGWVSIGRESQVQQCASPGDARTVRDTLRAQAPVERGVRWWSEPSRFTRLLRPDRDLLGVVGYGIEDGRRAVYPNPDPDNAATFGAPIHASQRHHAYVRVPYMLLTAVAGIFPAAWVVRRVCRGGRFGAGLCAGCGYDLRATPERCPECGRVRSA